MNRLFFRFFVLVMLSITVAAFVIYFAISRLFGDPLEDIARRQAAAEIFLLEQYVDQAPADEWLVRLNKVREVSRSQPGTGAAGQRARAPCRRAARGARARRDRARRGQQGVFPARRPGRRALHRQRRRGDPRAEPADRHRPRARDGGAALRHRRAGAADPDRAVVALALAGLAGAVGAWRTSLAPASCRRAPSVKPSASIYPLAERINHMAGRIEGLVESQANLLHSVSHELRTPIARLEFALELLRAKAPDGALEPRIAAMEGDLAELNALVGELLGMARIGAGGTLAARAVRPGAGAAGMRGRSHRGLTPQVGPQGPHRFEAALGSIDGDQRLLMRAVGNLLRNAEKYAKSRIILRRARAGSGDRDRGGGRRPRHPEAERERIFEPFYRLDRSRDRATGGFGLGLSIARKAVELHGGTIRAEQSPLGGARFVIALPAAAQ